MAIISTEIESLRDTTTLEISRRENILVEIKCNHYIISRRELILE